MRFIMTIIPLSFVPLLASCAILPFGGGNQRVVERYPTSPPHWLNEPFEQQGDRFYVVGRAVDVYSRALCVHEAKVNASRDLLEGLGNKARGEFSTALHGSDLTPQEAAPYLNTLADLTRKNVEDKGIIPDDTYDEKVMVGHLPHPRFYYNCEVRISFPMQNYVHARTVALSSFKDSAQGKVAETVAKFADKKFGDQGS